MNIRNDAGERIDTVSSDAEAARWFLEQGRRGDTLEDTGELLADVVGAVFDDVEWHYDRYGAVVTTWAPA